MILQMSDRVVYLNEELRMNMEEKNNLIVDKSFAFAVDIVNFVKQMQNVDKEFVLSKQLLKSSTSIGANINEAQYAQSNADFISKMSIALKETNETCYWLKLLNKTDFLDDNHYNQFNSSVNDIKHILIAIIKNSKSKLK